MLGQHTTAPSLNQRNLQIHPFKDTKNPKPKSPIDLLNSKKTGNCCAKRKHPVHPAEPSPQRIKVRMTAARFKELVSQAELSEGDGDIGRLVLEEYLKGSRHDRVISTDFRSLEDLGKFRSLEAIAEEE